MSKSSILLDSLTSFFQDPKNYEVLEDILVKKTGVSLRKLETFITIQSKRENITYKTREGKTFMVHVAYKSSLDGYSKKLFDPFCRTERIQFMGISTTVAQLNFIRWCIINGIIDFIRSRDESMCHLKTKVPNSHNDMCVENNDSLDHSQIAVLSS
jgi:hypothetical protein